MLVRNPWKKEGEYNGADASLKKKHTNNSSASGSGVYEGHPVPHGEPVMVDVAEGIPVDVE